MESLSTFVQSPLFSQFSVAIGGLITLGFFWWRAGSIHSVLDRIWRLIAGKANVHDPILKSLLQESHDIEKFQFIYRLKVETMAEMRNLASWMKVHGVGMARLQKMHQWIDVTSTEVVRPPPKHYVLSHLVFACLATLAIIGLVQLATSHDAYLQMRTSKVWFKTNGVTVKAPLEGWSFDRARCAANRDTVAQLAGFSASETDVICNALKDDGLKPLVKQTIEFQGWTGIIGVVLALVLAFVNLGAAGAAQAAQRLRKQLYPPDASNPSTDGEKPTVTNPASSTPDEAVSHH